jgi:dTDP-4-dehydrorhamnose reductase
MFTVGILGKNGQLGQALLRRSADGDMAVEAFGHTSCDIADQNSVERGLKAKALDVVVNAAAYTAVDQAESEPERAYAVNAMGPANLAVFCTRKHIPLIHISTDYVFDGTQGTPYRESDAIAPLGVYGTSKAQGEENVRKLSEQHIIIRTAWLYSATGRNFVKTMLGLGREKPVLKVVDDQHGCPTSAADLAAAVWQIIRSIRRNDQPCWGTYHYCNQGETTWYGLAQAVFDSARAYPGYPLQVERLLPIPTSDYPTPARRPAYSVLNCDLIQSTFAMKIRSWQTALHDTMNELMDLPMKVAL